MSAKKTTNSNKSKQQAYQLILDMILNMEIKPGETVTEIALSDRLKLGRTPVREALKKLEMEGLIITTNRRKRIYILTIKEITEIFDIKICLESNMARLAATRCKSSNCSELRKAIKEMKDLSETNPKNEKEEDERLRKWISADRKLHNSIFRMAGNQKVEQIINNLNLQWQRLRIGIYMLEGRIEKTYSEHNAFVQAILNNNPEEAEEKMRHHLEIVKKELCKLLRLFNYPVE